MLGCENKVKLKLMMSKEICNMSSNDLWNVLERHAHHVHWLE